MRVRHLDLGPALLDRGVDLLPLPLVVDQRRQQIGQRVHHAPGR
jgi:hypothetical protein